MQFVRVHDPEQVRETLREAAMILMELDPTAELRVPLFEKAVDLLAARTAVQVQSVPMDLSTLRVRP